MSRPDPGGSPGGSPGAAPATLAECRDAEDYFRLLGVEFDQHVLNVNRLHVMRAFGTELAALGPGEPGPAAEDAGRRAAAADALRRVYAAFAESGALRHRVFQVLKDRAPNGFVPLDAVQLEHGRGVEP